MCHIFLWIRRFVHWPMRNIFWCKAICWQLLFKGTDHINKPLFCANIMFCKLVIQFWHQHSLLMQILLINLHFKLVYCIHSEPIYLFLYFYNKYVRLVFCWNTIWRYMGRKSSFLSWFIGTDLIKHNSLNVLSLAIYTQVTS